MREIKFRAWDNDNKVMHFSNENEDDIVWEITPLIKFLEMRTIDSFPGGEYHLQEDAWVAPNQTLMQYTGLLDKNGKEIYEGDILNSVHKNQHGTFNKIVSVKENEFYVGNGEYDEETIVGGWLIETEDFFHELDSFEIIGNIYENPELLK